MGFTDVFQGVSQSRYGSIAVPIVAPNSGRLLRTGGDPGSPSTAQRLSAVSIGSGRVIWVDVKICHLNYFCV